MIPSSCRRFSRFLLNHSLLNHTLREHGIGNLLEAGDIRADNVVTRDFILVGGIVEALKMLCMVSRKRWSV